MACLLMFMLTGCAAEQANNPGSASTSNSEALSDQSGKGLQDILELPDGESELPEAEGQENVEPEREGPEVGESETGGQEVGEAQAEGEEAGEPEQEDSKGEVSETEENISGIESNSPGITIGNESESEDDTAGNSDISGSGALEEELPEDGIYTSKDDVALYIYLYGHLPSNFITKKEAEKLGWKGGSLEPYAPDKCIGGSRFGNYEGLLPEKDGRTYTECDIDTLGADKRGAKRIVFSNDGLIYYTEDHYESFELLYGEE